MARNGVGSVAILRKSQGKLPRGAIQAGIGREGEKETWRKLESAMGCSLEPCGQWERPRDGSRPQLPALSSISCTCTMDVGILTLPSPGAPFFSRCPFHS